ncbi:bestrophin-1 [Cherax quadricarinatus]|uniref:bestrophin-1 n=1 Tax=Cherax quadricarinatus TaxID=27406 RepID=UPI00237825A8|nr:bestrophin-1-like [Cherax quadricarinatus]XP_053636605.1 bestrophin-1-like [Cherax quadricarinatus]
MTVQYTDLVASQGGFFKLLIRWRGSVYKTVWQDIVVYLIFFYVISFIYRFALNDSERRLFEKVVISFTRYRTLIPVSFVLGFYVALVVSRWWDIYRSMPWPDTLAILASTYIPGSNRGSRTVRNSVLRYINLGIAITFATVSPVVKDKLSTIQDLRREGYVTDKEMQILRRLDEQTDQHKAWVPIMWATKTLQQARQDGLIASDIALQTLVEEILSLRLKCGSLLGYYGNNIPLVYTQVVTIAVYAYFTFSLLGEQFLDTTKGYDGQLVDFYVPIFALLQLFFYLGWLKVAEALLNPFGDDDHDFEFLSYLERNIKMSKLLCDAMPSDLPPDMEEAENIASGKVFVVKGVSTNRSSGNDNMAAKDRFKNSLI